MDDQLRDFMLATTEEILTAQLRAVRSLRSRRPATPKEERQSRSHVDMAYAILHDAQQPLHVSQIIERAAQRFDIEIDRESLVSSLTKRVARKDRFDRVGPNRFTVRPEE